MLLGKIVVPVQSTVVKEQAQQSRMALEPTSRCTGCKVDLLALTPLKTSYPHPSDEARREERI
jgi:hypothetical protein